MPAGNTSAGTPPVSPASASAVSYEHPHAGMQATGIPFFCCSRSTMWHRKVPIVHARCRLTKAAYPLRLHLLKRSACKPHEV